MGPWNDDISCTHDLDYPSGKSSLIKNVTLALKYILRKASKSGSHIPPRLAGAGPPIIWPPPPPSWQHTTALVTVSMPEIKITGHGMLALRRWSCYGDWLRSTSNNTIIWQEQMIADKPPTRKNSHGLYGIEFSPEGLMRCGIENWGRGEIFGLIQVRGKFIIHSDCTLRAEFARIICIFVLPDSYTNETVPALTKNYPNTPVYVLHKKQIAELLFQKLNRKKEAQND